MEKPITIGDVAARAGVSRTTVSHALSGRRSVAAATLARVREAAEELGYRPSQVASSLRTKRTQMVGLIVPDIANPFYPAVARGLHDVIAADGYYTIIGSTDGKRETEIGFLDGMVRRSVDGIVVFSFAVEEQDLTKVVPARTPMVVATGRLPTSHDWVGTDDAGGRPGPGRVRHPPQRLHRRWRTTSRRRAARSAQATARRGLRQRPDRDR